VDTYRPAGVLLTRWWVLPKRRSGARV